MLFATTKTQKIALAKSLGQHDALFLADLKMLGERFGPFKIVGYEANDFAIHKRVVKTALEGIVDG